MIHRLVAALAALLMLAACVGAPVIDASEPAAAQTPRFDALAFFEGRLEGRGQLDTVFGGPTDIHVASSGRREGEALRLTQVIREGDKPLRTRRWVIREVAPGRYSGTLTDAKGAVTGTTHGNRLRLSFTLANGMPVEQWLTLSPDGRRAYNVLTVRKFGVPVAKLAEDIRKLD